MAVSTLRWGRIVLGGFLGELLLVLAIVPLNLAGSSESVMTFVAVAGSFLVFVPVAWWLTRSVARPILQGVLMGAVAAAIYIVLSVLGRMFVPDAPPMPFIYYVAHALKLAGGAVGGWLALRSSAASGSGSPAHAS
jgi:hypothetical protein